MTSGMYLDSVSYHFVVVDFEKQSRTVWFENEPQLILFLGLTKSFRAGMDKRYAFVAPLHLTSWAGVIYA